MLDVQERRIADITDVDRQGEGNGRMSVEAMEHVGVVAIGRNEGERLRLCLESVMAKVKAVVYVDSGSTDGSMDLARSMGATVVELDLLKPFTAARSRNAGIARLREIDPDIEFVQVVDSDCEIVSGWLECALASLQAHPNVAVVCGRRRERFPEASVYNRLCDMEWNTPIGDAEACGGDAMIRLTAFDRVNGYDESIIAGEEPELCLRLRVDGCKILRLDHEMTLHDVQMTRFGQWWKRMVRSGHAYAEGRALHGRKHGYCVHQTRSIVEWAFLLPALAISLAWLTWGASLLLLGGYGALWYRVKSHRLADGDSPGDASLYAQYCVLGKFAQFQGMFRYWCNRMLGRKTGLIEYKTATEPAVNVHQVAEASKP